MLYDLVYCFFVKGVDVRRFVMVKDCLFVFYYKGWSDWSLFGKVVSIWFDLGMVSIMNINRYIIKKIFFVWSGFDFFVGNCEE